MKWHINLSAIAIVLIPGPIYFLFFALLWFPALCEKVPCVYIVHSVVMIPEYFFKKIWFIKQYQKCWGLDLALQYFFSFSTSHHADVLGGAIQIDLVGTKLKKARLKAFTHYQSFHLEWTLPFLLIVRVNVSSVLIMSFINISLNPCLQRTVWKSLHYRKRWSCQDILYSGINNAEYFWKSLFDV